MQKRGRGLNGGNEFCFIFPCRTISSPSPRFPVSPSFKADGGPQKVLQVSKFKSLEKNETKIRVSHPSSVYMDPHTDPAFPQSIWIQIRIYRLGMTHFKGKPFKTSSIFVSLLNCWQGSVLLLRKKSNNWKKLTFRMFTHTFVQNKREFSTPGSGYRIRRLHKLCDRLKSRRKTSRKWKIFDKLAWDWLRQPRCRGNS